VAKCTTYICGICGLCVVGGGRGVWCGVWCVVCVVCGVCEVCGCGPRRLEVWVWVWGVCMQHTGICRAQWRRVVTGHGVRYPHRTGCGACGLGPTHWVWRLRLRLPTPGLVGSPYVHSSCLVLVSFAGMSTYLRLPPPRAFTQVFPTAGLYKAVSAKKSGSPTGSRPRSFVYSPWYRPPPVVAARAQASRPVI
jgi:hypothetical protein